VRNGGGPIAIARNPLSELMDHEVRW
jgi:hypothetical protein